MKVKPQQRIQHLADTFSITLQDTTTSRFHRGKPAKRRRLWQAVAGLSIVIVLLGVLAWQQGGDGGSAGPLNAIAEAAEKTQSEPGARAAMRAIVSPARSGAFTMTGQIVFDGEDRSKAVISVPRYGADGSVKLEAVIDGTVMYMRSSRFGSLPGGAKWISLDLSLGEDLHAQLPTDINAKGELGLLEAVTGKVQKLGKGNVRGVPTTHYRGTVGVSEQVERLREEGGEDLASLVEKKGSPLRVEAWIDADGLVRRMRLVHSEPPEKGREPMTIDMRMDFFDFGIDPAIDIPESSETFDVTSRTRSELGLSKGD